MRRFNFIVLFLLTSAAAGFAQNSPLVTFEELLETLKRGYTVRGTFYYQKCDLYMDDKKMEKSRDEVGGMSIESFDYFGRNAVKNQKAFIAFSDSEMIEDPQGIGYVYNYTHIRIYEDRKVVISKRNVDPITFENRMEERFETTLHDGKSTTAGAFFFVSH